MHNEHQWFPTLVQQHLGTLHDVSERTQRSQIGQTDALRPAMGLDLPSGCPETLGGSVGGV